MPKTIMTVDDSSSVRQMVRFTLTEEGYQVIEASNGQEALAKMDAGVDMVITDLNMPIMNGIELIREIRKRSDSCRFIPIIMLTTESQNEKKMEGKAAGATGWIVKPFRPDQLLSVVKKVLP
ncbi:MAG: response regulator [bacterium]|nr:response regulator [bacterium]